MGAETVLVTGGAGFIGSHVAKRLLAAGHRVVVFDDLSGGNLDNVPAGAKFVAGDVSCERAVARLFEEWRFSKVWHLASWAAENASHGRRAFTYANNVVGSANVVAESVRGGVGHFTFISSSAVYGDGGDRPHREEDRCCPIDPYGVAKLAVEGDLRAAAREFGLRSTVFRLHNVYGPRQNMRDPQRNAVAVFLRCALEGRPLPMVGDGSQTRSFTSVGDVAGPVALAPWGLEPGTYNLGTDEVTSVIDLARMVCAAVGVELRTEPLPPRKEAKQLRVDHSKLGPCKTALRDGLAQFVAWARGRHD